MPQKTALITGVTGQDGAYLSEFLLNKGYIVHGIKRRSSLFNTDRIDHLYHDTHEEGRPFYLHYGDMTDSMNLTRIIQETQPDEIYNLAAMSHVHVCKVLEPRRGRQGCREHAHVPHGACGRGGDRLRDQLRPLATFEDRELFSGSFAWCRVRDGPCGCDIRAGIA